MEAREQLLQAALKVYAESGTRGATTRRIAQEAGVNEVTLFRHFGSKDALHSRGAGVAGGAGAGRPDAARAAGRPRSRADRSSAGSIIACSREYRSIIRKCMGEFEEHPEMNEVARASTRCGLPTSCRPTCSGCAPLGLAQRRLECARRRRDADGRAVLRRDGSRLHAGALFLLRARRHPLLRRRCSSAAIGVKPSEVGARGSGSTGVVRS